MKKKKQKQKNGSFGIELDKIEIPNLFQTKEPTFIDNIEETASKPAAAPITGSGEKQGRLVRTIVFALPFFSILALIVFWVSEMEEQSFTEKPKAVTPIDNLPYVNIGPILTGSKDTGEIEFKLFIRYKSPRMKQRIERLEPAIKNRFIMVLDTPEMQIHLKNKNINMIKPLLIEELKAVLGEEHLDDVYFSKIMFHRSGDPDKPPPRIIF